MKPKINTIITLTPSFILFCGPVWYCFLQSMNTKISDKRTQKLEREVKLLRSFVIGQAGKDPEGSYNPAFVKKILRAAEQKPEYTFKDTESFLQDVQSK